MKNLILASVLAVSASFLGPSKSEASDLAGCYFHFNVKIKSTLIFQRGGGTGYLECADIEGRKSKSLVNISIRGLGLGLGIFEFEGVSKNLGVLDAERLEGSYYIVDANVAVGVGAGLSIGLYNQQNGLSIDAKVKAGKGLGAAINGSEWLITLAP